MTSKAESIEYLKAQIENILLEENSLSQLKEAITKLVKNQITPRKMRQMILEQRLGMLELITDLFPFFLNSIKHKEKFGINGNSQVEEELKNKLKEREDLLTEVALKLHNLHVNLETQNIPEIESS
jgi:hypothetical protein